MQIVHRISFSSTPEIRDELSALGIVVPSAGLVSFESDEANENWPALNAWVSKRRAVDFVSTKFSKKEINDARWLELVPGWHRGYPQPDEDNFGYLQATYDLTDYCKRCGIAKRQRAPFQLKSEPKWGRNGILQLNWVFDEYFATPQVWAAVFEPHGIRSRPVTNRKGVELKTVVQLVADEEVKIFTEGLPSETCGSCGRVRYLPVVRGPFPPLKKQPLAPMAKTTEYFGSGQAADKRGLISHAVARDLARDKVRRVSFRPVMASPGMAFPR